MDDALVAARQSYRQLREDRLRNVYAFVLVVGLLVIVGVPFLFFVWGSVWSTAPGLGGSFTLEAYFRFFQPAFFETIGNTLIVATVGATLSVLIGGSAAVFVAKTDLPIKHILATIFIVQYLIPPFVIAFGWEFYAQGSNSLLYNLATWLGIGYDVSIYNVWGIALVTGIYYSGLVYLLSVSAIGSIPAQLEEAARISGAGAFTIARKILFKLAFPSLSIAFILVFTRLVQSFGVPLILGLPRRVYVLATRMFIALTAGYPPDFAFAAAMGMAILVFAYGGVLVQNRIAGASEKYEVVGTKGGSTGSASLELGGWRYPLFVLILGLMTVFMLVPIFVILVAAVQPVWRGFDEPLSISLTHFHSVLFGQWAGDFWAAMGNTLFIAIFGALVGMFIASLASYIIIKSDSPLAAFLEFIALSPIAIPGIIVALAFMWIFLTYNFLGLYQTIWIIILAFTSRFLVIGTRVSNSAFRSISIELEEAAQVSGANLITILRRIYLPLIKPGFISGFTLLAIIYIKVLSIPLLLGGGRQNLVLAVLLWDLQSAGYPQAAAAVGILMMLTVGAGYLLLNRLANVDISNARF